MRTSPIKYFHLERYTNSHKRKIKNIKSKVKFKKYEFLQKKRHIFRNFSSVIESRKETTEQIILIYNIFRYGYFDYSLIFGNTR